MNLTQDEIREQAQELHNQVEKYYVALTKLQGMQNLCKHPRYASSAWWTRHPDREESELKHWLQHRECLDCKKRWVEELWM